MGAERSERKEGLRDRINPTRISTMRKDQISKKLSR
jgi:hypothetical protein